MRIIGDRLPTFHVTAIAGLVDPRRVLPFVSVTAA
jgi:hypothetical protein